MDVICCSSVVCLSSIAREDAPDFPQTSHFGTSTEDGPSGPPRKIPPSDQFELRGLDGGRRPRRLAELGADVGDVSVDRVRAEHEPLGYLPVREAVRDETQH